MENEKLVLLTTIKDQLTDHYVLTVLKTEGIDLLIKPFNAGGYLKIYMGASYKGEGVYVTADNIERGREILNDLDYNPTDHAYKPRSILIATIIFFLFAMVLLILAFGGVI